MVGVAPRRPPANYSCHLQTLRAIRKSQANASRLGLQWPSTALTGTQTKRRGAQRQIVSLRFSAPSAVLSHNIVPFREDFYHGWTRIHTDGKEGRTMLDTNCADYRQLNLRQFAKFASPRYPCLSVFIRVHPWLKKKLCGSAALCLCVNFVHRLRAGFPSVRRSGASAERHILLLHFSDGGFLPKAATLRNSRASALLLFKVKAMTGGFRVNPTRFLRTRTVISPDGFD